MTPFTVTRATTLSKVAVETIPFTVMIRYITILAETIIFPAAAAMIRYTQATVKM